MPGLEGTTLGPYRLLRRLGHGGMSEVYLAYDKRRNRQVAIKVVSGIHTEFLQRFHREAEAILNLNHPHILPAFEYGEDAPWHYLVMLYARHGTLSRRLAPLATDMGSAVGPGRASSSSRRLRRGFLALDEAGLLLEQIASALQYAHDSGIIHRDIKPSNILLRDNQYTYLADFGLAKALEGANSLTQTGSLLGTPEYMAPELTEGPAGMSSDIYALGVVLYQMLTGRVPFAGETPIATYWKHLREQPVPPSHYNHAIPRSVDLVVLRALEKNPRRRYQSAHALSSAYKRALRDPHLLHTEVRETPAFDFDLAELEAAFPASGLPPLPSPYPDQMAVPGDSFDPVGNIDPFASAEPVQTVNPILTPALPLEDAAVDDPYTFVAPYQSRSQDAPPPVSSVSGLASTHTLRAPRHSRSPARRRRNWYSNPVLVAASVGVSFLIIISILMSFVYVNYVSQQEVVATATARTYTTATANTLNATVTEQAQATATTSVLTSATSGSPILSENLVGNSSGRWPESANCQFIGGSYHVLIEQAGFLQTCVSPAVTVTNAAIQADVALISGNDAGLLLRARGQQFYEFGITDQGEFFFRRHDNSTSGYTYLINKTKSGAVATSSINRLTIIANGNDFKLYVNSTFVGETNDATYSSGQVGFATGTLASTSSGEGSFANLKIFAI